MVGGQDEGVAAEAGGGRAEWRGVTGGRDPQEPKEAAKTPTQAQAIRDAIRPSQRVHAPRVHLG